MRKLRGHLGLSLDFLVQSMPSKKLVELLLLHWFDLQFLVPASNVTGRWLSFLSGFGAFKNNVFPWHNG